MIGSRYLDMFLLRWRFLSTVALRTRVRSDPCSEAILGKCYLFQRCVRCTRVLSLIVTMSPSHRTWDPGMQINRRQVCRLCDEKSMLRKERKKTTHKHVVIKNKSTQDFDNFSYLDLAIRPSKPVLCWRACIASLRFILFFRFSLSLSLYL